MRKALLFFIFIVTITTMLFAKESLNFTQSEADRAVGPVNSVMPTSAITVEAWYYIIPNSDGPYKTIVSTGYAYNSAYGWMLRVPRSTQNEIPHVRIRTQNGSAYVNALSGTANEWHHLAFTYDGAEVKIYLDGTVQDSTSLTGAIRYDVADSLNVGEMANSISEPWNGYIDEVRIWDTALSDATINSWKDREIDNSHPNYSNLFVYYRLNEGSGQTISDDSGNNYDAVLGDDNTVETNDPAWYNDSPLPVILSEFTCSFINDTKILSWITESEFNNSYWNVYRSPSANYGQAVKINSERIEGQGTTSETTHYRYRDDFDTESGKTYYYWIESINFAGKSSLHGPVGLEIPQENNPEPPATLTQYGIISNYPNPFNPSTEIKFQIDKSQNAKLVIFDLKGRKIKTIFNGYVSSNSKIVKVWNGKNEKNITVPSGIYFCKLVTQDGIFAKKLLLSK